MKKMFIAMALCAGVLAFANVDCVEAADQQATEAACIGTAVDADMQQLSTRRDDDEC